MSDAVKEGRRTLVLATLVSVLLIGLFWPTVYKMVRQWIDIGSYSHGFLILPISLWLIWREREQLQMIPRRPTPVALLFVLGGGVLWMLAKLLGVQVIEQLAFIGLWIMALWATLGHALFRRLLFPLFFLLTMVPMGDALVEPLMVFTADFTVWMLKLTGIPVYREGFNFVVPSGNWSVVEACSGVRYLVAALTLGLLYAHLTYHSIWRKLLFVLMSIVAPILANGIRAYLIVLLGHLSDMKLAVGIDHLIYGWIFFGLVMLLLFWLGGLFIDKPLRPDAPQAQPAVIGGGAAASVGMVFATLLIALGVQTASAHLSGENAEQAPAFVMPAQLSGWQPVATVSDWPVAFPAADQVVKAAFEKQGRRVEVRLGLFLHQRQGHEVVSSDNKLLATRQAGWHVTEQGAMQLAGERVQFHELVSHEKGFLIGAATATLHTASWYRLGDKDTSNDYVGKYYQGLNLVTAGRTDGIYVILATEAGSDGRAVLQAFAEEALPHVWAAWDGYIKGESSVPQ